MSNEIHIDVLRNQKKNTDNPVTKAAFSAAIAALKLQDATSKGSKAGELIAKIFDCAEAIDQAPYPADGWLGRESDFEKACWNAFVGDGSGTVKSAQSLLTMLALIDNIRNLDNKVVMEMNKAFHLAKNNQGFSIGPVRIRAALDVLCRFLMTGSTAEKTEAVDNENK